MGTSPGILLHTEEQPTRAEANNNTSVAIFLKSLFSQN